MKAIKRIVVAVGLVVISAMAPVVRAQQGVEKAAPGTLVAPAEASKFAAEYDRKPDDKSGEGIPCRQVWICAKRGDFRTWATNRIHGRPHFRGVGHSRRASKLHFGFEA